MKVLFITILLCLSFFNGNQPGVCNSGKVSSDENTDGFPAIELKNDQVKMKLYLPDIKSGYYRGTRFDWSGIIYSLVYKGHGYFGEWRPVHNPTGSSDITGPVNGYLKPGLGYETADVGDEFVRIGVGAIKKIQESEYNPFKTYEIHNFGEWQTRSGKDWIEYTHTLQTQSGWSYVYKKHIQLTSSPAGFVISYSLKNLGDKTIETDQFNHNFFTIDGQTPGPGFYVEFPFHCKSVRRLANNRKSIVETSKNRLIFLEEVSERDVWMQLDGFGNFEKDNQFEVVNRKTGAGVKVVGSQPLYQLIFWANSKALSPETFVWLKVPPGEEMMWNAKYSLFTIE